MKNLVLIGGGHSHVIALRKFILNPLSGWRLTLISNVTHTPYSGMLPGHVAGYYNFEECHINLPSLAQLAQAQFCLDEAIGLDLENNQVFCANIPPIPFDILSIDIGSTPEKASVPGANQYAIPVKPVPDFLNKWQELITEINQYPQPDIMIVIVGGGAGGVELALAMQQRLKINYTPAQIHLIHRGAELMPNHNRWVRQHLHKLLVSRGIQLHLQETVSEVLRDKICCQSGLTIDCSYTFWVTQAAAPSWIEGSGLQTDGKGFILVSDTLQSLSHPQIFATGDIATMVNYPRPKAGVFAVRQGKPLFDNLCRFLLAKPLKPYKPQQLYLSLIGTGDQVAIASWGAWGWKSPLLWLWKDHIDRQFMAQFYNLPNPRKFV